MESSAPASTSKVDYYALLGVAKDADEDLIKQAYRRLVLKLHPDLHAQASSSTRRFQTVSEAYSVLMDPERRAAYDRDCDAEGYLRESSGGVRETLGAVLDSVFGVGKRKTRPGKDRVYRLEISLKLAALGGPQTLTLPARSDCSSCEGRGFEAGTIPDICERCAGRGEVLARPSLRTRPVWCDDCQGRGYVPQEPCQCCAGTGYLDGERVLDVSVPPGVSDGSRLLVRGAGEPGLSGGAAGDLLVDLSVAHHPHLRREGLDIVVDRPISVYTSLLGGEASVPTLLGMRTVTIPAGIRDGTILKLTGYGVRSEDGAVGDQRVCVRVEHPSSLDAMTRTTLEELAASTPPSQFEGTDTMDRALNEGSADDV
jgi:molecular chaperone DnaJ